MLTGAVVQGAAGRRGGGTGVVTGIFCGDLQFFAACFHARNRGLCFITMTGAVPPPGNITEGRKAAERYSPNYGHMMAKSLILYGPNSNPNPK